MCKLVLDGGSVSSFTSVSNVFIDEYMNKANGEFEEATNPALLSSRDGYLLELTGWTKGSQAS